MTNKLGLRESDLTSILDFLSKEPLITEAYIFGSRAKGNFKNGSDVDIALKGDSLTLDAVNKISYWFNEESSMPYRFDVLDYNTLESIDLKEHIDRVGVAIYRA
ncbi:COG1708 Predicted nucleotidyltransferases [Flavobacteriaceae bacterium]|jgi:predicted nucleotidyltransferase